MDLAEIVVTIGGVGLMALTLWFFFGKPEKKPQGSEVLYTCPMHPWIASKDPTANCSICGMKLVRGDAPQ